MAKVDHSSGSLKWEAPIGARLVSGPQPHEGLRRALLSSFGPIPAAPDDLLRLLDRLR